MPKEVRHLYYINQYLTLFGYPLNLVTHMFSSDDACGWVHAQLSWFCDLS